MLVELEETLKASPKRRRINQERARAQAL